MVGGAFVAGCSVGDETSGTRLLAGKLQAERINAPLVNK
jgi:hypothetical protein